MRAQLPVATCLSLAGARRWPNRAPEPEALVVAGRVPVVVADALVSVCSAVTSVRDASLVNVADDILAAPKPRATARRLAERSSEADVRLGARVTVSAIRNRPEVLVT